MRLFRNLRRLWRGKTIKRVRARVVPGKVIHTLSIVSTVRNEAHNLPEWIDFHLAQGVDHLYLFDNESTDATPQLLSSYARSGLVTVIPWPHRKGYHTQSRAFAHALRNFGGANRWMAFIDVDEFLYCPDGQALPEFLAGFAHRPALLVNRFTYGTSGFETPPPDVTGHYFWRMAAPEGPFHMRNLLAPKSIIQPLHVTAANGGHTFILRDSIYNGYDEADTPILRRQAPAFRAERIRINHYYTKDRQSFMIRVSRGKTVSNMVVPESHWLELLNEVESKAIVHDDSICRVRPTARQAAVPVSPHGSAQSSVSD